MDKIKTIYSYVFLEPPNKSNVNRFDFLDGYRGLLCLLVIMQHSQGFYSLSGDYEIFKRVGLYVGVSGFFILSSFLLTYRLLIEFQKASNTAQSLLVFIKYSIRRFFRIYVTFFLFVTAVKYGPERIGGYFHWFHVR